MEYIEFIECVKIQTAEISVGASTLRNQGGRGLVQKAREYLKQLALENYGSVDSQEKFRGLLDGHTGDLKSGFPIYAQNWGAARKVMNIFLRNVTYNRFLCQQYGLKRIERWLEVPIDRDVATGLIRNFRDNPQLEVSLPSWHSIKRLTPQENDNFQQAAQVLADSEEIDRVHVDLLYWRSRNA
ncbi:hypothetical protein M1N62_06170 [Thermodesulfovibrionales bacterium]|nr:hypothetical protein [Thermodesulfovibrionales bacterium]